MSLDNFVSGNSGLSLEAVDILRKMLQQHTLIVEQFDE